MSERDRGAGSKPRVVFYMPGLAVGGAERHTIDLRRRLAVLGYPTAVIVHSDVVSPVMQAMPGAGGAEVLGLRGAPSLAATLRTRAAFKGANADIIFAVNLMRAAWAVALRALGATRAPIVCICHSTSPLPADERRLPAYRFAARFVDAMVYVSRNQMVYWAGRRLKARRSLAIVNGVDLQRFKDASEAKAEAKLRLGLEPESYVVGLLGAFRPEKNQLELVQAAAQMRDAGVPVKVLFVGDGNTRRLVQARVADLAIEDDVIFAGEFDDVGPVIAAFDVGVLCSTTETFSLAALELLASGVPMVMTNVGGASEIVEPNVNGFLYEQGDTDALVQYLTLLSDDTKRGAFRSRARSSVERYSTEAMVEHYVRLIDDLAANRLGESF